MAALLRDDDTSRFLKAYNDPQFGWFAATRLYNAGAEKFPLLAEGSMRWVQLAWMYMMDLPRWRRMPQFEPIKEAYDLHSRADNATARSVIEAALITKDATVEIVAKRMGLDLQVLQAYDALFFNVTERKGDAMFIRHVVYPNTRLEELVENHVSPTHLGRTLLRMGYNKDLDAVMFFGGFKQDYLANMTGPQAQEQFLKEMMLHGYLLASNGFLNHQKQHVSISSARAIVQASKMGGETTGQEASVGVFADILREQLDRDRFEIRHAIDVEVSAAG